MKTTPILVGLLLLSTAVVALAPAAEARQACVWPDSDPCDDYLVCAWNRVTSEWTCFVRVHAWPNPCDPRFCDPYVLYWVDDLLEAVLP